MGTEKPVLDSPPEVDAPPRADLPAPLDPPRDAHMRAVGGLCYAASHLADEADRLLTALAGTEPETQLEAACRTWLVDAVTLARTALAEERRTFDVMSGGRS